MKCFAFAILAAFIAVVFAGKIEQDPAALENAIAARDIFSAFKCPNVGASEEEEEEEEEEEDDSKEEDDGEKEDDGKETYDGEKEDRASEKCLKNANLRYKDFMLLSACGIYDKNNISKLKEFVACYLEVYKVLVNGAFNDNAIEKILPISKDEAGLYINECGSIQGENALDTNFKKLLCYNGFYRSRLPTE